MLEYLMINNPETIRTYYTLEDVVAIALDLHRSEPFPTLGSWQDVIEGICIKAGVSNPTNVNALNDVYLNNLLIQYIYPRFYQEAILYIDSEDETDVLTDAELAENFLPWIGRIYTWLMNTKDKYEKLITLYTSQENKLLEQVSSQTQTLVNDTPQNGGDVIADDYVSNVATTTASTDAATPIARLSEIKDNLNNLYEEWARGFNRYMLY